MYQTIRLEFRQRIGIVFQSPSLDKKLTVDENIACQAALYGLSGATMRRRRDEVLELMHITDRRSDLCEKLSGGLKRRVELAKGILHQPPVMLLDEPSTGLDPSARLDLWQSLRSMADSGVTVLLTTHLLEEADKADRIAIMAEGKIIAEGSPTNLRAAMGDGLVTVTGSDLDSVEKVIREELGLLTTRVHQQVRIQSNDAASLVPILAKRFGDQVQSIAVGRPGLEDVFIEKKQVTDSFNDACFPAKLFQFCIASPCPTLTSTIPSSTSSDSHAAIDRLEDAVIAQAPAGIAAAWMLACREWTRFFRQRNRVISAVVQPLLFWLLFGTGLKGAFVGAGNQNFLEFFLPGTIALIVLFTAIFSTISVIEDRREGFHAIGIGGPRGSLAGF